MNLLKLIPKKLRKNYEKYLLNAGIKIPPEKYISKMLILGFIFSIVISLALSFFGVSPLLSFFAALIALQVILYFRLALKAAARIGRIETVFPDFIQLMSSNLRAGMTVDRAFLSSARPELSPLDEEISKTGREIATGRDIASAFKNMGERINSEKINKTISLIISGLKAGGNISTLLETTATNMREKEFLQKRAASNVLMYVIFITVAVGIGAPVLFGLSSVLIEIIIKLTAQLPAVQATQMNLPFTLSNIGLSAKFVLYFALVFLIVIDIISSLVIGLVNKGDEKYGLKYVLPLMGLSIVIFFGVRLFLYRFLVESFTIIS
jgi:hypothetical protein